MSTRSKPFNAWALPSGVALPKGTKDQYETGGRRVRYPHASAEWIRHVTEALADARDGLLARPASALADTLGRVGVRFLDADDPLRRSALELLPPTSGLSPRMAEAVLDGMATDWTADRLRGMLEADLGDIEALDRFVTSAHGRVRAVGPRLCTQIVSGSVPGVGVTALLRSLLVKAPTLLKPGHGDVALPVLFAAALREEDPDLADAAAVLYWPGGSELLEDAAMEAADLVTAYGDDETIRSLRARGPATALFVPYHHRVSLAVVGRGALDRTSVRRAACAAAGSVAFFDQRGCVSAQVVYVEEGGEVDPRAFTTELAGSLAMLEELLPGGSLDAREASAVQQVRGTAELLAASGEGMEVHHGGKASWTVIYDPSATFTASCGGRVVRVKPVGDVLQVAASAAPFRKHMQTVGVVGCEDRLEQLASALAMVGVTRVAPLTSVPFPPPWWHHDGRGPLRALLRWVDLEE